jgi:YgiT-type zinc finger domain-containing protein
MKCVICKNGETKKGFVTVTLTRGSATLVFRDVPADICDNCAEEYVSDETTNRLLLDANESVKFRVQVDVRHFLAA